MPICSQCSKEKARDAYTKAQLRKTDATRRCKQCIEAEGSSQESSSTSARQNKIIARREQEAINEMERQRHSHPSVAARTDLHGRASLYQPPPPPPPSTPLSEKLKTQVQEVFRAAFIIRYWMQLASKRMTCFWISVREMERWC
jgi:hypothetical protein